MNEPADDKSGSKHPIDKDPALMELRRMYAHCRKHRDQHKKVADDESLSLTERLAAQHYQAAYDDMAEHVGIRGVQRRAGLLNESSDDHE